MDYQALAIILAAVAVGSFAKGAVGIGLPIIAIPTAAAFLGVEHAIVVMTIPVFASNIWICWRYRKLATKIPNLPVAVICASVGTLVGSVILATLSDSALIWILIVWIAKTMTMKIGGVRGYRRSIPFWYGTMVGYLFGIALSSLVDAVWFPDEGHFVHGF